MYKLILEKGYKDMEFIFNDLDLLTAFAKTALEHSEEPIEAKIVLVKEEVIAKEGENSELV